MWTIIQKLYQIGLLKPKGFFVFLQMLLKHGTNLIPLVSWVAQMKPNQTAVVDDEGSCTYEQLYNRIEQLIAVCYHNNTVQKGQKVGLLCRNHITLVQSIFALSRLGADVYLLNPDMSPTQWDDLKDKVAFDVLIYDEDVEGLLSNEKHIQTISVTTIKKWSTIDIKTIPKIPKVYKSKLVILTGGTTGNFKLAARKPSLFTFLNPFFALLTRLNLGQYQSVYVATPIYHGFGLSSVLIGTVLGAKMVMMERFDAVKAAQCIAKEQVEVATLVPLMLQRLLVEDKQLLDSLEVILSGGAALSPTLVKQTSEILGSNKLANLYGTSEAGFSIMATPLDLAKYPATIGKTIKGVTLKVLDESGTVSPDGRVGDLCLQSNWTMSNKKDNWIRTGDLGYRNSEGYYFLCGRVDDMIVSGGENVYPIELENLLRKHPAVADVAAVGVTDEEFGHRLQVHVVFQTNQEDMDVTEIKKWLKTNAARHQQPRDIIVHGSLPYTAIGKLDRKKLKREE